jgi:hypothetical protein
VVLIACDLIRLAPDDALELRRMIGARLGLPVSHVLINTSHTHATPDSPRFHLADKSSDGGDADAFASYWAALPNRLVELTQDADRNARPARYGIGLGDLRIGVNRREQLPDGTMVLGENPNGVVDPTVNVVRFDELDGTPLAVLVNYACHPDVLGPKSDLISADYVGAARSTVETLLGAPMLFFQGAAGDIDPRCGIVLGADGVDEMHRLGTELGCEVARVCQEIHTVRQRDHRVEWKSAAAVVTAWAYEDVEAPFVRSLAAASRTLSLPLRPLPDEGAARRLLEAERQALETVLDRPSSLVERLVARRRVSWAEVQLEAVERGTPPTLDFELQVLRLDDLAVVAVPGELFVEIGLRMKERSLLSHTFVFGYSNGTYFYIPTAAAFPYGGYEIESYRNYQQPSGPTPEWEDLLVAAAGEMIASLAVADR